MNTYLFAYYECENVIIKRIAAKSIKDFESKFVRWAFDKWEFVTNEEFEDLLYELEDHKIYISKIEEID